MTKVPDSSKKDTGGVIVKPPSKKQISPSKKWVFTLNNWTEKEYSSIVLKLKEKTTYYVVGKEKGEEGTPHLQGYFELKTKGRPIGIFKNERIWFQKAKGSREDNKEYCEKDGNSISSVEKVEVISRNDFYKWEEDLMKKLEEPHKDREINWYVDEKGGCGKSTFTKYLVVKHKAILLSGKGADMKHGIVKYMENNTAPKIVIIDLPRTFDTQYLSYTGIEEIENGCFFSGKYEGGMVVFNRPHIVIFSNEEPDTHKLSMDKWNIISL